MNEELWSRRYSTAIKFFQTGSLERTAEIISKEFKVKKATVLKDLKRRHKWIPYIINPKDEGELIKCCIYDINRYSKKVERLASKAKNDGIKLGSYRLLLDINFRLLKFFDSNGKKELKEQIGKLDTKLDKLLDTKKHDF